MQRLREAFDLVIVDAPPIGIYPETTSLARFSNGAVLVLEAESDRQEVAEVAKRTLEAAGGSLLGAMLNKQRRYIPGWLYRIL